MPKINRIYIPAFAAAFLMMALSCQRSLERKALVGYILDPENGISFRYDENGLTWHSNFIPADILKYNELKRSSVKLDSGSQNSLYDDKLFFSVGVSKEGGELLNYRTSDISGGVGMGEIATTLRNSIYIETSNGQIIYPQFSFSPRTYGLASQTRVIVGIESSQINESDWIRIIISGKESGMEVHYFEYDISDIKRVPKIKIPKDENA